MKTIGIEFPSVYAKNGKIDVEEISIKAELDSSHDICFLIRGRNKTGGALIEQSKDINVILSKMNDLMLQLLNRQAFALNAAAKEME